MLGKKSWNIYNAANIARVRRDEAAARAAEEAEERRLQEVDAQRRLAILRGHAPPPVEADAEPRDAPAPPRDDVGGRPRRERRRHGEDDTEFELRLARGRGEPQAKALVAARRHTSSEPLVDGAGHIDLFGDERSRAHAKTNEEAEEEARRKRRDYEDQYTMHFSNAAGKQGLARPWYAQHDETIVAEAPSKDVWGNEDPRRKEREAQRLVNNDPLAMMKMGAARARAVKHERQRLQEEQQEELRRLEKEHRRRHKERRRHHERRRSPTASSETRSSHHRHHGDDHGRSKRRRRDSHSRERGASRYET